jgi:hypothetical protein
MNKLLEIRDSFEHLQPRAQPGVNVRPEKWAK